MHIHPIDWHQINWQQWAAFAIVAVAAFFVFKRLWSQIAAFRSRPARRRSVRPASAHSQPARPEPLIQIQTTPPRHMRRPPADDTLP